MAEDIKTMKKAQSSRQQSMKEQSYNKEQREGPRPHELNDKSNLIDLIKGRYNVSVPALHKKPRRYKVQYAVSRRTL
ncbi:hypothetical protein Tco_1500473 [Tanacetum coccineum]